MNRPFWMICSKAVWKHTFVNTSKRRTMTECGQSRTAFRCCMCFVWRWTMQTFCRILHLDSPVR